MVIFFNKQGINVKEQNNAYELIKMLGEFCVTSG